MIRGKAGGLEIVFSGRPFADAYEELLERLRDGGSFYRGTQASVSFDQAPSADDLQRIAVALSGAGISWDGAYALADAAETVTPRAAPQRSVQLSESARSLIADFAGARSDLRQRRHRGPGPRRKTDAPPLVAVAERPTAPAAAEPSVLYHRGTLRGGQSLANVGHVVVVGDVNPGAELVAGGDILVFGALRGVAHAGAQGDRSARVYALVLEPTQLRIATTIAAGMERTGPHEPEEAFLDGERIAIVAAGDVPHLRPTAENA
jgi:septum site-determining protein MinC